MEHKGSLPHPQEPARCPYPEPDQFSPCPLPTSWGHILILSPHLRLGLPSGLFPPVKPVKALCDLSSPPYVLQTPSISFVSIWSPKSYLVRSIDHKLIVMYSSPLPRYLFFSTLLSNSLSMLSSVDVSDQVSHPYRTGRIIILYTLTYRLYFCTANRKTKDYAKKRTCFTSTISDARLFTHQRDLYVGIATTIFFFHEPNCSQYQPLINI
jgi:hypothetical protein